MPLLEAPWWQNRISVCIMQTLNTGRATISAVLGDTSSRPKRLRELASHAGAAGLVVAGIVAALLAVGVWRSDPLRLTLLGGFATLGLFVVFGLLAGLFRLSGARTGAGDEAMPSEIAEALADGVAVSDATGRIVYANPALRSLALSDGDGIDPLRALVRGRPAAEEALFRLFRAAERGEQRSELIRLERTPEAVPAGAGSGAPERWLRLTARLLGPAEGEPSAPAGPRRILWQASDVTADRHDDHRARAELERTLSHYSQLPAGLLVSDRDGRVVEMNDWLRRRLDLDAADVASGDLRLGDVLSNDSAALLEGCLGDEAAMVSRLDLTFLRQRRFGHPAAALVARNAATGGCGIVVLDPLDASSGTLAGARDVDAAAFFHSAPFGIATLSDTGLITSANAALGRLLLISRSPVNSPAALILARDAAADVRARIEAQIAAALAGEVRITPVEITLGANKDLTRRLFLAPLNRTPSEPAGAMLYVVDATEQKALELRYAQSQRMEAVGQLVGGISHDFNNVLTAIIGWSELLLGTLRPGDPGFKNISNIKQSARRAADLVNQLMAFSRQQTLQPEVLQLGEVLSEQSVLITRLLGEKVDLRIKHDRELWHVKADRTQITQVVMNLAVNARDAMPDGGKLTIRTRNVSERDSRRSADRNLAVGEYVLVEVRDSGTGMPPDVMAKIFEPFYTTKGIGKGTGLGLSTVYGIVKQTGGYVFVDSEVGRGTTFRVYLPRHVVDETAEVTPHRAGGEERMRDLTGSGRVLIVEDEDSVRSLTDEALRRQGYTVLQASTGQEALDLLVENDFAVDLVVSDVIMPEMDGPTLLAEVRKVRPDMKIILVSGYPDEAFRTNMDPGKSFAFLQKPYTLAQLAAKVKDELTRN